MKIGPLEVEISSKIQARRRPFRDHIVTNLSPLPMGIQGNPNGHTKKVQYNITFCWKFKLQEDLSS